ncbi:MAG TPA: GyrI-like domain-containing protein [Terracidiphilus sp.]
MIERPQIVTTEAVTMAKIYARIPTSAIRQEMGKLVQELVGGIRAQNVDITGPWFTHHLHRPGEFFDFEVCMPVAAEVKAEGRMEPGVWPAMEVVRAVYPGGYEGLPGAWGEFMAWTQSQGVTISEEIWERYLIGPESGSDPAKWRTELNREVS